MSRKRPLSDEKISATLNDLADSEDGLDFDDDSIADPDFIPALETFEDGVSEIDIDLDYIIESIEMIDESPSSSTATAPTHESTAQPSHAKNVRKDTKGKPDKLNLRWKNKNLELNAEQLMFMGNKTLGPDLLELDTPVQFFFYLFPNELINKLSEETNLYQVQKDPNRKMSSYRGSQI